MFVRGPSHGFSARVEEEKCTCWVLMRGDGPENLDRHTADCELVPDPACPVHSRKYFPILEE
jgi:hypothetical protein